MSCRLIAESLEFVAKIKNLLNSDIQNKSVWEFLDIILSEEGTFHTFTLQIKLQDVNQSINQSISQSINQSVTKPINHSFIHLLIHSFIQFINQSINKSIHQSINQSTRSIDCSVNIRLMTIATCI